MVLATTLSGVFLVAIYPVVNRGMPSEQVGVFMTMLRLFTVLAIPAAGLQVVMAQEAAAALTAEQQERLALTARSVLRGIFVIWCVIVLVCAFLSDEIIAALKISNPAALWITLGLVLAQLCLPVMQGLLQGTQKFLWLGWSVMLNGAGRFVGVLLLVFMLKSHSTGALLGAFIGMASAVLIGFWPSRALFRPGYGTGRVPWGEWLGRVVPLTGGVGSILFIMNADVLFVQSHFSAGIAPLYSAVAVLGVGLVSFTAPISAVMFPKLVKSAALAQKSDSLYLALAGTASLGVLSAVVCTLLPVLPLRIIHFNKPEFWQSALLVPWFMWAMIPLTLANVLVNNLLAKQHFKVVPWLVLIAVAYGLNLRGYLSGANVLYHFEVYKDVVLRLGVFSFLLFLVALAFTRREPKS